MNRQAVKTALGRGSGLSAVESCRFATGYATSTPSTFFPVPSIARGRQTFSTTSTSRAENDSSNKNRRPSSRERSQVAASQIVQLRSSKPAVAGAAPVDARSLGAAGFARRTPIDPSKVFSLRSIRGGPLLGGGLRGGPPSGGALGGGTLNVSIRGGPLRGRSGRVYGPRTPGADGKITLGPFAGREGGFSGGSGGMARGRGSGMSARGRGGRGGRDGQRKKKKQEYDQDSGKMVLTAEEQELVDKMDQGVLVDYAPKLTKRELLGYGPAVASDAVRAKVESTMEAMRMLGGAKAFNSDAGVTGDTRETVRRYYHEKKPVFFNTPEEKTWMESSKQGFKIRAPEDSTKQAIIDMAVRGKYEKPSFVDATDSFALIARYHGQTTSYKASDSMKFINKVRELMPVETTARPAAPAAKTA